MDQPPKHRWLENPFKALQVLPEEGEGQDPTSYIVREHENRWGEHVADISKDIAIQAATQGRFGDTPASEQTVDVAAMEVMDLHPNIYRQAVVYHRNNPDAGWGAAIRAAKLTAGKGPYDPKVYIPPNERIGTQKGDPLESVNPNYDPIEGADELTERFRSQWQRKARTGDKTYYYDITGHRILDVPGMNDPAQQARYKSWLTQSLINRKNQQLLNPQVPFTHFHSNQSFYDTKGMEWRLVRTDKSGKGPDQPYEPMPLNEIDSRKLKAKNTSPEEKALLTELVKTSVKDRNSLEKANPWLVEWNADTSGQNYHEHMIGLDESEFWNSGAGKAEGYMNNDVYNIEKGLGNVVALRDPRFKLMKDLIADYITPRGKTEIYPGLKKRTEDVKKFTDGPYKGLNAVIGYDANPTSKEFTNLVIRAYNPDPNTNFSIVVSHIPNWYSNVYAKDLDTGNPVIPEEIANAFIRNYVDAVLSGNQPDIVKLEELGTHMFDSYGITKEIPAPGGLKQDTDFQNLGEYSTKSIDPDPLDLKTFKTTPKNQRRIDSYWKRQLLLWKEGRYKQLKLDLDQLFE